MRGGSPLCGRKENINRIRGKKKSRKTGSSRGKRLQPIERRNRAFIDQRKRTEKKEKRRMNNRGLLSVKGRGKRGMQGNPSPARAEILHLNKINWPAEEGGREKKKKPNTGVSPCIRKMSITIERDPGEKRGGTTGRGGEKRM